MIVYGDGLKPWLEEQLHERFQPGTTYIGQVIDGQIVNACGFVYYTGDDVELNVAGSRATPRLLRSIYGYVFKTLGCRRCSVRIRADNDRSIRLVERTGYVLEGRLRKAKNGHDLLIYGLLKEDCKWLAPPIPRSQ